MSEREVWFVVADVHQRTLEACQAIEDVTQVQRLDPESLELTEIDPAALGQVRDPLVEARARVRTALGELRGVLADQLPPHEAEAILLAMVVHADEKIRNAAPMGTRSWPPLQRELFDFDDGGQRFYERLETLERRDEVHPLVFQVFYFCLDDGFMGAYVTDPRRREQKRLALAERIRALLEAPPRGEQPQGEVELLRFPWQYYAVAAGACLALYLVLQLLSMLEIRT